MPRRTRDDDRRQPGLILVAPGTRAVTDADRSAAARLVRLEPFWLNFRAQRQQYAVCWYDAAARTGRGILTGVGPGPTAEAPLEARQALAAHYTAASRPQAPQPAAAAGLSAILTTYLAEHCSKLRDPAKDAVAVEQFEAFTGDLRRRGLLPPLVTVADLTEDLIDRFIAHRREIGDVGETINRKLATIRGAVNREWKKRRITEKPYIQQVPEEECSGPRELEWSIEQVAAILEAAWSVVDRRHVHLFAITSLSTHARTDAILDCNLDAQRRGKLIDWLRPGDKLTRKRRSVVPVPPSLDEWITDRKGKLIQYRALKAERNWADPKVPDYFERDTWDIGKALGAAIVAAGLAHPSLGLVAPLIGADGEQAMRTFTKRNPATGRVPDPVLLWRPLGTPNTFRHTCHTYVETVGVPPAQIDLAAGHAPRKGSGRNYSHLRPEYLREFVAAIEGYWTEMDGLTRVHRRNQCGTKVVYLPSARIGAA